MAGEDSEAIHPFRLDGGRFERASADDVVGFPLSASRELARYDDLVHAVARRLWREDHPAAGQVPRDFEAKVRLRMTAVDRGSVKPAMRTLAGEGAIGTHLEGYGDRARNVIAAALAVFVSSGTITTAFPSEEITGLARLAKSLGDDEVAIFSGPDGADVRYLRTDQRRLAHYVATTRPRSGEILGMVTAIDPDNSRFTFRLPSGKKVDGRFAGRDANALLMGVVAKQELAPYVALECDYQIDASDRVASVDSVRSVTAISHPDDPLGPRLRQLAEFPRNWDGAGADPPSIKALRVAQQVAHACATAGVRLPHAFLSLEGGVLLEEQPDDVRWTLEIEPDGAMIIAIAGGGSTPRVEEPNTPAEAAASLGTFLS